jgi:glycosyltransferase involved in cell wall biosynthesis
MSSFRVMFHSVAPWCHSGYGQQINQILPRVKDRGYTTACVCYEGLEHGILEIEGVRYYPRILDPMGLDALAQHAYHFQPDVVITLTDIWPLDMAALRELRELGVRWIPMVPVDHEPAPPPVLQRLAYAQEVVTFSPFGHRELERLGNPSTMIPLTVDTTVFTPQERRECRRELGIPEDIFLFGKGFQQALDAFAAFHRRHPASGLYLHTFFESRGGFQIEAYAEFLGIRDAIYEMDDYAKLYLLDQKSMAGVYSAFDCLLMPSSSEAFGVPIIEAMACGVPVLTSDFASMRDLVQEGETGFKVRALYLRYTSLLSYVAEPCAAHLEELMEAVFEADREAMGKKARSFVIEHYDTAAIWQSCWEPFLERLECEGES